MKLRTLAVLAVVAIALAAGIFFLLNNFSHAPVAPVAQTQAPGGASQSASEPAGAPQAQAPAPGAAPQVPPSAPADPEFQKFIEREAKQVDNLRVDSAQKTRQMSEVVSKLTPSQARQLLQTAQNPASSAGERILSAYLMVEAGPRAEGELRQLITSPLNYPGAHPAHSEMEARAMQERSVRVMALEGLISRAEKEPSAREALGKTIPDIPDPYIKGYAQRRLDEIKPH